MLAGRLQAFSHPSRCEFAVGVSDRAGITGVEVISKGAAAEVNPFHAPAWVSPGLHWWVWVYPEVQGKKEMTHGGSWPLGWKNIYLCSTCIQKEGIIPIPFHFRDGHFLNSGWIFWKVPLKIELTLGVQQKFPPVMRKFIWRILFPLLDLGFASKHFLNQTHFWGICLGFTTGIYGTQKYLERMGPWGRNWASEGKGRFHLTSPNHHEFPLGSVTSKA